PAAGATQLAGSRLYRIAAGYASARPALSVLLWAEYSRVQRVRVVRGDAGPLVLRQCVPCRDLARMRAIRAEDAVGGLGGLGAHVSAAAALGRRAASFAPRRSADGRVRRTGRQEHFAGLGDRLCRVDAGRTDRE